MKKYKYRVISMAIAPGRTSDLMNELGDNGFDLVTVQDGLAYFKKELEEEESRVEEEGPTLTQPVTPAPVDIPLPDSYRLRDMEKKLIQECVLKNERKIAISAKELGISIRTLYRKLEEYDLNHLLPRNRDI